MRAPYRTFPLAVITCAVLAGCTTWAAPDTCAFTVQAPGLVRRGEHLVFRVETRDDSGKAVEGMKYSYLVDWVGLSGMVHTGVSYTDEKIVVKGGAGAAKLRVFARGEGKNRVQVAEREIRVE